MEVFDCQCLGRILPYSTCRSKRTCSITLCSGWLWQCCCPRLLWLSSRPLQKFVLLNVAGWRLVSKVVQSFVVTTPSHIRAFRMQGRDIWVISRSAGITRFSAGVRHQTEITSRNGRKERRRGNVSPKSNRQFDRIPQTHVRRLTKCCRERQIGSTRNIYASILVPDCKLLVWCLRHSRMQVPCDSKQDIGARSLVVPRDLVYALDFIYNLLLASLRLPI
jgi:hypothetical protein